MQCNILVGQAGAFFGFVLGCSCLFLLFFLTNSMVVRFLLWLGEEEEGVPTASSELAPALFYTVHSNLNKNE